MLVWLQGIGGLFSGLGALTAAFVAVFAIRHQESASIRALAAQAQATRDAREHERSLATDERLWLRRADLYARITLAMREQVERFVEEGKWEEPLAEVPVMASLVSEADILASSEAKGLLNEFVYRDMDMETKIGVWTVFQNTARRELTGGTA